MRTRRLAATASRLLSAGLLIALTGCGGADGPELTTVTGTVKLDGQALPGARLEFTPRDGSPSYGTTDEEGRYELRYSRKKAGAVVGPHVVRISTFQDEDDAGRRVAERVPVQFNLKSELVREVAPGENAVDFELSSRGAVVQPDHVRR